MLICTRCDRTVTPRSWRGWAAHPQPGLWDQARRTIFLPSAPTVLPSMVRTHPPSLLLTSYLSRHKADCAGGREKPWSMRGLLVLDRPRPGQASLQDSQPCNLLQLPCRGPGPAHASPTPSLGQRRPGLQLPAWSGTKDAGHTEGGQRATATLEMCGARL